jgi:hypothetical protein
VGVAVAERAQDVHGVLLGSMMSGARQGMPRTL